MNTYLIPHFGLARQHSYLKEELLEATDLVLRSGQFIAGEYTKRFEKWLRNKTGYSYASVTHSGTQALEFIAAYYYNNWFLEGNDNTPTIRIPNLTYPATLNAFISTGWNIELVDTDNIGVIKSADTSYDSCVKYSCFVGLYGAIPNTLVNNNTIIDGAQHWLAQSAFLGLPMAISFDPTKNLYATGNGGAVLTDEYLLYEFVEEFKNNGKSLHRYAGTNSKMSELDCAHILVRSNYIDAWQERRKQIRLYYLERFKDLPIKCLSRDVERHADQKFVIYLSNRNDLHDYLLARGIESKVHYPYALSELPISIDVQIKSDLLSNSVMLSRGVLSLPIHSELTDSETEAVSDAVCKFFDK
jgi:UDP-2-acetamido-2-deoxy-ribo-hexuluronate aminotransferase